MSKEQKFRKVLEEKLKKMKKTLLKIYEIEIFLNIVNMLLPLNYKD